MNGNSILEVMRTECTTPPCCDGVAAWYYKLYSYKVQAVVPEKLDSNPAEWLVCCKPFRYGIDPQ